MPHGHVSTGQVVWFGFTGGHFHRNWRDDSFRTLVLNGPEALTGNQTVEIAGRVLGRPFSVQRAPLAAIRVIRAIVGPFNEHVSALLGLMLGQEEPATAASAFPPMYVEFGVTPTMFADYVRSQAGSGR